MRRNVDPHQRPQPPAGAQDTGIAALAFLAAEPELLQRFLGLSGLDVADLRQAATDPGFFPALLDFILADETTLLRFAEHAQLRPERIESARRALNGLPESDDS